MIIPSIDIAGGEAVQLIGGRERALTAGDPLPLAKKFGRVGAVAVIDLDAALSRGNNAEQIRALLPVTRCRVGGGIRDVATAIAWLDAGADKIILGTAATPEILRQLPKDRVIVALDAIHDRHSRAGGNPERVEESSQRPLCRAEGTAARGSRSPLGERVRERGSSQKSPLAPLGERARERGSRDATFPKTDSPTVDSTATEPPADGQVFDHGWTRDTGATVLERMKVLRDHVSGFLITFVEREGRLTGIDLPTIRRYVEAAGEAKVTIAGGIATAAEIAALDEIGADAQVGMALYTDRISLAECLCAPLCSDRADGLWPTIVVSESGQALGLAYSNLASVSLSLETGLGHYWSRRRGLWKKGETSGAVQELLAIDLDCDRDTLRFTVRQTGRGFCHLDRTTCFGNLAGMAGLERRLHDRLESAPSGSYTRRLFESSQLLASKLTEEAAELAAATTREELIHEAADLLFFAVARLVQEHIGWSEVERELDCRALRITRRGGDAKQASQLCNRPVPEH